MSGDVLSRPVDSPDTGPPSAAGRPPRLPDGPTAAARHGAGDEEVDIREEGGHVADEEGDEGEELLRRLHARRSGGSAGAGGPQRLVEEVVALYLPFARRMAGQFRGRGVADEELLQVASVGLMKAVRGYEPGPGRVFVAYAAPTIRGELKRHFRDQGWAVRPPRRLQELSAELSGVVQRLTHELGRSPTYREIAAAAGAGEEEVIEAVVAGQGYTTTSLDVPRGEDGSTWADLLPDGAGEVDLVSDRVALRGLLLQLPARERRILALRFFAGMTQSGIGEEVGVSQVQVSRLLSGSLARLRQQLDDDSVGSTDVDDEHLTEGRTTV